jgi:hypothetical protein
LMRVSDASTFSQAASSNALRITGSISARMKL